MRCGSSVYMFGNADALSGLHRNAALSATIFEQYPQNSAWTDAKSAGTMPADMMIPDYVEASVSQYRHR